MEALRKTGHEKNTLVIFTSDQGSFFPNLPYRGTKAVGTTLYEGGQKVPFMVKWPGKVEEGSRSAELVQTTDVFPTLCEIAGQDPSAFKGLEGKSLLSLITRGEKIKRDCIIAFRSYDPQFASVLTPDHWKLIAYRGGRFELFKVDEDISEENDLASRHPERVDRLSAMLEEWLERTGVPITINE